jgi:hypothetical protein
METKQLNPFEDMIGQQVPTVEPQTLVEFWDDCYKFWKVQRPHVERSRLELITVLYRTQILTTILKGAKPDQIAFQTAASIPLTWPDSEYQMKLARTPLTHAPFWWRVYSRLAVRRLARRRV